MPNARSTSRRPSSHHRVQQRRVAVVLVLLLAAVVALPARAGGPDGRKDVFRLGDATLGILDVTSNDGHPDGRAIFIDSLDTAGNTCADLASPVALSVLGGGQGDYDVVSFSMAEPLPDGTSCVFYYLLSDGESTQRVKVKINSLEPKDGGGILAQDDLIAVDPAGSGASSVDVLATSAEILANDEPAGAIGLQSVGDGALGTCSLQPDGVHYLSSSASFWSLGDECDYTIAALDDPELRDSATIRFEPTALLAQDDDVYVGLGLLSPLIPVAALLANDAPAGEVEVLEILDADLPPHHRVLWNPGDPYVIFFTPPPGVMGAVGELLGTFRYRAGRTDGGTGTAVATASVYVGDVLLDARDDFVVADFSVSLDGTPSYPPHVTVPFADLRANDEPEDGVSVIDLYPWNLGVLSAVQWDWNGFLQEGALLLLSNCTEPCGGDAGYYNFWRRGYAVPTYTLALDDGSAADTARVTVLSAVVPRDDVVVMAEGGTRAVSFQPAFFDPASILVNDLGPDDLTATAFPVLPQHGSLELLGFRTAIYTPLDGFLGQDPFSYTAASAYCDATWSGECPRGEAVVQMDVQPIVPRPDSLELAADATSLAFPVASLLADDAPLGQVESAGFTAPAQGKLTLTDPDPATGGYLYEPGAGFATAAVDAFTQRVTAAGGGSVVREERVFLLTLPPPGAEITRSGFEGAQIPLPVLQQGSGSVALSAAAAVGGSQGVEVGVDAGSVFQLLDDSAPTAEDHFHARFVVTPGGLDIPPGERPLIAQGAAVDAALVGVRLAAEAAGVYRFWLEVGDAAGTTLHAADVTHDGGPHAVHLEWWASPWPGAATGGQTLGAAGGARLWVDGALVAERLDLDNVADRLSWFDFGAVGDAAGSAGSLGFDDYAAWSESRRCTVTLADSFEGIQPSTAWSTWAKNGGGFAATAAAALEGARGLAASMDGGHVIATRSLLPPAAGGAAQGAESLDLHLGFDPGTASIAESQGHGIVALRAPDGELVAWLRVRRLGTAWEISAVASLEDGALAITPWTALPAPPVALRWEWWALPPTRGGGGIRVWAGGLPLTGLVGLTNRHLQASDLQLGSVVGTTATSQGAFYFDEVVACAVPWDAAGTGGAP